MRAKYVLAVLLFMFMGRTEALAQTAPSSVAKAAYAYIANSLHQEQGFTQYIFKSYDDNVCHVMYFFVVPPAGVDLKYGFNMNDIAIDDIQIEDGTVSGWSGITIKATTGKNFVMQSNNGKMNRVTKIKLSMIQPPSQTLLRAFTKLAIECGAERLPF